MVLGHHDVISASFTKDSLIFLGLDGNIAYLAGDNYYEYNVKSGDARVVDIKSWPHVLQSAAVTTDDSDWFKFNDVDLRNQMRMSMAAQLVQALDGTPVVGTKMYHEWFHETFTSKNTYAGFITREDLEKLWIPARRIISQPGDTNYAEILDFVRMNFPEFDKWFDEDYDNKYALITYNYLEPDQFTFLRLLVSQQVDTDELKKSLKARGLSHQAQLTSLYGKGWKVDPDMSIEQLVTTIEHRSE